MDFPIGFSLAAQELDGYRETETPPIGKTQILPDEKRGG
jgi:hypothetical protein